MTDDGGQRAERNQKSEVGSRRSEDRGKKGKKGDIHEIMTFLLANCIS